MSHILTANEAGAALLAAFGINPEKSLWNELHLCIVAGEVPALTIRRYVRGDDGTLDRLKQAVEHYRLVAFDPSTEVATIEGIKYAWPLFQGLASIPIGGRVEIVSRDDGVVVLREIPA